MDFDLELFPPTAKVHSKFTVALIHRVGLTMHDNNLKMNDAFYPTFKLLYAVRTQRIQHPSDGAVAAADNDPDIWNLPEHL